MAGTAAATSAELGAGASCSGGGCCPTESEEPAAEPPKARAEESLVSSQAEPELTASATLLAGGFAGPLLVPGSEGPAVQVVGMLVHPAAASSSVLGTLPVGRTGSTVASVGLVLGIGNGLGGGRAAASGSAGVARRVFDAMPRRTMNSPKSKETSQYGSQYAGRHFFAGLPVSGGLHSYAKAVGVSARHGGLLHRSRSRDGSSSRDGRGRHLESWRDASHDFDNASHEGRSNGRNGSAAHNMLVDMPMSDSGQALLAGDEVYVREDLLLLTGEVSASSPREAKVFCPPRQRCSGASLPVKL